MAATGYYSMGQTEGIPLDRYALHTLLCKATVETLYNGHHEDREKWAL